MNFKTPDPRMAGAITSVLLALFAFSYVVPVLDVSWLRKDAHFDQALQQNLLLLLVLAVGYYIGTSKSSDDKTEIIRQQAGAAATLAAVMPPATENGTPIVKVDTSSSPLDVREVHEPASEPVPTAKS